MKNYRNVITLLISLWISTNAFAASSSLLLSGSASQTCSFASVNPGTLAVNMANTAQIGTNVSGGTSGSFTIQYLGTPTVTVEEAQGFSTKPSGVSNSDFGFTTSVISGSSVSYSANQGVLTGSYTGGSADQLTVNLLATKSNGQPVPIGNYGTTLAITCQ